jgi:hypothetical protein
VFGLATTLAITGCVILDLEDPRWVSSGSTTSINCQRHAAPGDF